MGDLLENIIQSKVKRKLLKLFLFNKNKKYHTRELSRIIEEPISAVQREIKKLLQLQIIIKYPEGNIINYFLNTQNPFYEDLKKVVIKTSTEPREFFKLLISSKSLNIIALYGESVKAPMKFSEPLKLLIVGSMESEILNEYLKAIMDIFNREYELLYYSNEQYKKEAENNKKFQTILKSKQLLYLKNDFKS
ncbi:MAG: hypothetical protein PHV30_08755 [Candidatus Margulisbacteria bacterium]|nr:hypothetical protein [Candidatus Margulisiibacteriota bacterium]